MNNKTQDKLMTKLNEKYKIKLHLKKLKQKEDLL